MIGVTAGTRHRGGTPTNVGGRPSFPATTDTTILGSLQPVSGSDLQKLPEGDRSRVVMKLYAQAELRTATPGGAPADEVTFGGVRYLVYQSQPWPAVGGIPAHWRCLLVKVQESQG